MSGAHQTRIQHRIRRRRQPTLTNWVSDAPSMDGKPLPRNVVKNCGWGRLIFGHTFDDPQALADLLKDERPGARDIALYIRDPHVVLAMAPQDLFLDPSHTYRLWLNELRAPRRRPRGFSVVRLRTHEDAEAMNTIYDRVGMVSAPEEFLVENSRNREMTYFIAIGSEPGQVFGAVSGVDHVEVFGDPEYGSSLWSLAVDPVAAPPGVGEALVGQLAAHYAARGRAFMDLSVMHDNTAAIELYERLGFRRVPVFCIKRKNPINEPLFTVPPDDEALNPYAEIIVAEARRRGIGVRVLDAEGGYFRLTHGGVSIDCRESLSALTNAVAMSRCDDKRVTRRILKAAGLAVPAQRVADGGEGDLAFLHRHKRIVVKPARGEQGQGVQVDIRNKRDLKTALRRARRHSPTVILEEYCPGVDLRIVVINKRVVAAAVRRPAEVMGTGTHTIRELIEKQSRRRAEATGGESRIPLDAETERCVRAAGHDLDTVLPESVVLPVRRSANLHTGGTIHDVTDQLHLKLVEAAETAAQALDIPVTGLDFIVEAPHRPDYVIIEANERPGLANHEPQPTAERFVDLLFPQTAQR
ncbi:MAG TPA: N-acetylglutaminylglutamine synthetase [Alphaproteobacteria bacterium]